ncbi:MAG TPA: Chromate resistance protein ChrB [Fimbriimonas sp.]
MPTPWTLLVYRIPSQPSKLRLNVWRKLASLGALYLQDAVCVLPSRPDTDDAFRDVYRTIVESGGSGFLFESKILEPADEEQVVEGFRKLSDDRLTTIQGRLDATLEMLSGKVGLADLEVAEESLKRERVAYLRAQSISYMGGTKEAEVESRLRRLQQSLDSIRDAILG